MVRTVGVRARWAVPAGAVAAVGIVIAASAVASASVPSLPHRTAAQLLAGVGQAAGKPLGPLTATVQQTADLGLPQLPQIGQSGDNSNLTAGMQSINIWYRDPRHIRIAEPVQAGESDLRLGGRTLWLWSSKTQTATRVMLPAHATGLPDLYGNGVGPVPSPNAGSGAGSLPDSPMAAASQVLKAVGPSTVVGVQSNVYVASRPAYQLALQPRSEQSLVGEVLIAIDASRQIPLRVEVFGRGSAGLAYSIGFTSLTFGTPAASNFSFTPPPGATVRNRSVPSSLPSALRRAGLSPASLAGLSGGNPMGQSGFSAGSGDQVKLRRVAAVPVPKKILARINAKFAKTLPASMTKVQRAKAIKAFDKHLAVRSGLLRSTGGGFAPVAHGQAAQPRVIGKDWLSVIAVPANPQVAGAVRALVSAHEPGSAPQSPLGNSSSQSASSITSTSTSSTSAYGSTLKIRFGPNPDLAMLRTLLLATTPVHGSWGSGRLLQTKLLSVLITSKGQILAGAVTPAVLYADVAADAG